MKYYLITDTHYSHKRMIEFGRKEGYETKITDNLKSTLNQSDILIHLGDVCFQNDAEQHELYIKHLPFRKWLVRGNHDNRSHQWFIEYGWDFVSEGIIFERFGKRVLLSHYPTEGNFDINIHGHLHWGTYKKCNDREPYNSEKSVLLSLEYADYKPILLDSIITGNKYVAKDIEKEYPNSPTLPYKTHVRKWIDRYSAENKIEVSRWQIVKI